MLYLTRLCWSVMKKLRTTTSVLRVIFPRGRRVGLLVLYSYVPPQRVWLFSVLVINRVSILAILVLNRVSPRLWLLIGYGFCIL